MIFLVIFKVIIETSCTKFILNQNQLYFNVVAISDKNHVDYERVHKYCLDDLADLEVKF